MILQVHFQQSSLEFSTYSVLPNAELTDHHTMACTTLLKGARKTDWAGSQTTNAVFSHVHVFSLFSILIISSY